MTLIGALATSDFVAQVSDRRLTLAGKPFDETANKSVVLCSHMAFGYSGLAVLGQERVDDWLVRVLLETKMGPISEIFLHVIAQANEAVSSLGLQASKKHLAIIVTGWVQASRGEAYVPFIANISNGLDSNWRWMETARDEFTCQLLRLDDLDNKVVALYWLGQPVPKRIEMRTRRSLRKRRKKGAGPRLAVQMLVDAIREVAANNAAVGSDLMAISVPLESVGSNYIQVSLRDIFPEDQVASQYFFTGSDEGIRYVPHYVGCYKDEFFSITHAQVATGAAARELAKAMEVDPENAKARIAHDEDDEE
jgi:hypothetical protein